ncbi:MAG: FadR/GntR family transcriptional regulator [Pseudomonadota bacterium]
MSGLQLFHPRQSDTIVSHIKNLVVQGVLRPGDRIPAERSLAKELGLGRGTIREAFQQLEAFGLIERSTRSRVVRSATPTNGDTQDSQFARTIEDERGFLLQIIDVRIGLEGWVAAEAARKALPDDIQKLRKIIADMERAALRKSDLSPLDIAFHRALVEATRNPVALQVLEALTTMISSIAAFKKLTLDPNRKVHTHAHRQVVEAVERGAPEAAQAAMTAHLEATRAAIGGAS